jgi:hypothetical protein
MTSDMQDFQNRGEPLRQQLGIDGTAGDAQDVRHPFTRDPVLGCCLACGLAETARVHD